MSSCVEHGDLMSCLKLTPLFSTIFELVLQYGSHSKKRPNNLILGRTYDHHIYDLVEVGVENYKSMESYVYDKKLAPKLGSKPFFAFIGEHFESSEDLKHLKEVLLDLFRGEVNHLSIEAGMRDMDILFSFIINCSVKCRL